MGHHGFAVLHPPLPVGVLGYRPELFHGRGGRHPDQARDQLAAILSSCEQLACAWADRADRLRRVRSPLRAVEGITDCARQLRQQVQTWRAQVGLS